MSPQKGAFRCRSNQPGIDAVTDAVECKCMSISAISEHYLADEAPLVNRLLGIAEIPQARAEEVVKRAAGWVRRVRRLRGDQSPLDAFMRQYDLSSEEGVLLMCLAEALLRIPDEETAEKLIA